MNWHMDLITANDNDSRTELGASVSRELMKSVFAVSDGLLIGSRRSYAVGLM
jgi:hypothetical protein